MRPFQQSVLAMSVLVSALSQPAIANEAALAQTIVLNLDDALKVSSPAVAKLREMRTAFETGKFDTCVTLASKAVKSAKSLEPWILTLELECAAKLPVKAPSAERLRTALAAADAKTNLMAFGPWSLRLRQAWARARLLALEVDLKFNRSRAWSHVEKLSAAMAAGGAATNGASALLDEAGRAKLWRLAGELMFLVQKNDGAREFFRRSLAEQDQPDLRDRLKTLNQGLTSESNSSPPLPPTVKLPDGSPAEIELADRITTEQKSGDLVAAAEDGLKLLNEYPGSSRAKWAADRMQDSLVSVSEKSSEQFQPVRESLLKTMEKADPDRVAEWARVLFNRGLWAESAKLGKVAAEKQAAGRATKTIELALDAAYAIDDFKTVKALGEELVEKHAGTASARTAALRLGLLAFRQQDFSKAAAIFEKLIATPSSESLELQARYWLWRSLEKSKADRAKAEAEELARRFPFSYYGLRARLEGAGGTLEWAKENPKADAKSDAKQNRIENKVWVTQEEKQSFDRAMVLVSAGWFDEAQSELAVLPAPVTPDAKAVRARVWAAAKNYLVASRLANDAWDAKFELRRPELMSFVWPSEYRDYFESTAKAKNLDPWLTRSLAKQESGYNKKAVSSSNALGLMQMIPPTAREIADDLKLGKLSLPDDMFEPERNIKMGTHYVAKMLNQFKGHVPLALAAYNAGPARVERWVKSRPSLQGLETTRTSAPENEIWIDEFPFSETSFYVKAILRNQMVYQLNETGRLATQEPLWKSATLSTRP